MEFRNILGQITDMSEADKVAYFTDGLKPATRMEVTYQAPANFENAWTLAIRYDIAIYNTGKTPEKSHNNKGKAHSHKYSNKYKSVPLPPSSSSSSTSTPMELDQLE